jgi:hypothetical protein
MFIFCFDVVCYLFRSMVKVLETNSSEAGEPYSAEHCDQSHPTSIHLPGYLPSCVDTRLCCHPAGKPCTSTHLVHKPTSHSAHDTHPPPHPAGDHAKPLHWLQAVLEMAPQLANMALLYTIIALLNRRARRSGHNAARQEELLLSACIAMALCNLLGSLGADNASDYVYMGYFLICSSTFLKIRWWLGTALLAAPVGLLNLWRYRLTMQLLSMDAIVHIMVAWAVGGLMAYLNDWYRRQMFANQKLAAFAHDKELLEARARIKAQRALAAAQVRLLFMLGRSHSCGFGVAGLCTRTCCRAVHTHLLQGCARAPVAGLCMRTC